MILPDIFKIFLQTTHFLCGSCFQTFLLPVISSIHFLAYNITLKKMMCDHYTLIRICCFYLVIKCV